MNSRFANNEKTNAGFFGNLVFRYSLFLFMICCLCGCGDFFAEKPTELQARAILEELKQIKENPNIENQLPELYLKPPSRINIAGGIKLFYFTRHHPASILAGLLNQQLGLKVTQNVSTNQLIVFCPDDQTADKVLEYLQMVDVPPIQVNIDCLILERFGDTTMDWETSTLIENFLGEGVTLGEKRGTFDDDGKLTSLLPVFPGAALREAERSEFGLDFGYWMDENVPGHQVRAVVDMLESKGYLKILLNPTLETVNGKEATVTIKDYSSFQKIVTGIAGSEAYNITDYMWVEDTLTVTPSVFADGFIGLKTEIKIGSRSKPEGVTQAAIITERSINIEENRIKPGKSLIIGGMRKSENRSVLRGIPFFKDLPIIGILFSSKDYEEKATEIIFILTPSISSGGQEYAKVMANIRKKHNIPQYEAGLTDMLKKPFGLDVYSTLLEEEATNAEAAKVKAQSETVEAERDAQAEKQHADETQAEADKAKADADAAIAAANRIKAQVEAAKTTVETERTAAKKARAEAEAAKAAAEKAKAAAEKSKAEADAAKAAAEKVKAEAEAAKAAVEKAKAQQQNQAPPPDQP
jgi:hypothetical protein